jgi:hypothetical protein
MLVQHDGFVGIYSHFGLILPVLLAGKHSVAAGEKLGVVDTGGITLGPHLYFEMIVSGKPVDPGPYMAVPLCKTKTELLRTTAIDPEPHGIRLGGKIYYQLFLPDTRSYWWQRQ